MPNAKPWTCASCGTEQTHEAWCESCSHGRYVSMEVQLAEHVLEHIAAGIVEPLEMLKAMQARECYAKLHLTLNKIAQTMRLVTTDTRDLARRIARALSAPLMLDVARTGDNKDKLALLAKWGPDVNSEHHDHKGEVVHTFNLNLHDGPPPPKQS